MSALLNNSSAPSVMFNGDSDVKSYGKQHMEIQGRVSDSNKHILNMLQTNSLLNSDNISDLRYESTKNSDDTTFNILTTIDKSNCNKVNSIMGLNDIITDKDCNVELNSDKLSAQIGDTMCLVNETNREVLLRSKDIDRKLMELQNEIERENADKDYEIKLEQLKNKILLENQSCKDDFLIKMENLKIKEEISSQREECCFEFKESTNSRNCELKKTIDECGNKNRNLIDFTTITALRDQLELANSTLLIDQLKASMSGIVIPTPPSTIEASSATTTAVPSLSTLGSSPVYLHKLNA